jgi:UDP-N-acetylmuramyl pentapeptide phosphotransferase/UDP-N-acetylglucosamine-1-phosphate transferase
LKKSILDIPNERSSHSTPTPRSGGLAIVIAWYTGISILFIWGLVGKNLYFALLSGILLAVISLIDDISGVRPSFRLIAQTITVIIAFCFLNGIQPVLLFGKDFIPAALLYPVVVVGMVYFINLYNFLDGIDGYASLEAISLALFFYYFTGQSINIVLIAAVAGFLIWNRPKARIFMGDVGSTQLGFIIVVLGISFHNENSLSIINWLILTAPFWFDATLTLFRRWRNREKLSQAHRKHIYQRLVQSGFSHLKVDILLMVTNIFIFILTLIFLDNIMLQIPLLIVTIILLYMAAIYTDRRKQF